MKTLLLAVLVAISLSCSDVGVSPGDRQFNVRLRYGVFARNELNTFRNTYTKDLVLDGTVTVSFVLSELELQQIRYTMHAIGFFGYPETLYVIPNDSIVEMHQPYNSYDFEVRDGSTTKRLHWDDWAVSNDMRAWKLYEVITLIRTIIESKSEYRQLPQIRGGYV